MAKKPRQGWDEADASKPVTLDEDLRPILWGGFFMMMGVAAAMFAFLFYIF